MDIALEHANLTVASAEKTIHFLGTAFPEWKVRGSGKRQQKPSQGNWVHFGNNDFYMALQENDLHLAHNDEFYVNDGINHLGFVIEDMAELLIRMQAAGYKPTDVSDLDGHPFRKRAYFFDGNGFEWEFVQYLSEAQEQRNDYSL